MDAATDETAADDGLTGLIGYNLKRAYSIVQADLAQVLGGFRLRAVSYSALDVVVRHPGISQTRMAEALNIERSNLVQIVDELAGRALIVRAPVPGDRRRHALMPTRAGQNLLARAEAAVMAHEARMFAGLSEAERVELLRLLAKFRKAAAPPDPG